MGKLFKIRWSLLFPLSFQSCKSKDPSTLPSAPIPLPPNSIINLPPPTILPLSPPPAPAAAAAESQLFRWQEERDCLIVSAVQPTSAEPEKKHNKKKTRKQRTPISTTPSPDSEWFSSDDGEATETIISTDSCSSTIDCHDRLLLPTICEIAPVRGPIRRTRRRRRMMRQRRIGRVKRVVGNGGAPVPEGVSPARLSRFCSIEGKVRESFAVVKRSVEPLEDFKRSMVEMILEKEMVEVGELEELLRCFLSLNSRDHHGLIVEAFAQIYEAMFSESPLIS